MSKWPRYYGRQQTSNPQRHGHPFKTKYIVN